MVSISSTKRKRVSLKKATAAENASQYPPSYLFSALTYKQAPEAISISTQGVIISAPTPPNSTQFNTISGDIFRLESTHGTTSAKSVKQIEKYHDQNTITHLEWNQTGNTIASVDETGQLGLWHVKNSIHQWELIHTVDLKQPIVAFIWLNSERSYNIQSDNSIKRDPLLGPRNPFGQLGFITVTAHGEITVHFQRNASIFSTFSTPMPNIGRREISRADAGCFGMSLAGLDDWERISHAAITYDAQGRIYLATHNASIEPKSVAIHEIRIKFQSGADNKGAIECKPLTQLKVQRTDMLKKNNLSQMVFKKGVEPVELVLCFGEEEEGETFNSYISSWQLKQIKQSISSDFGSISTDRIALVYQSGTRIEGRFISSLKTTNTGQIIVGLSDGSIHAEFCRAENTNSLLKNNLDSSNDITLESFDISFWQVTQGHKSSDGCDDPIAYTALSPNETHLLYIFSSAKVGVSRITNDDPSDDLMRTIEQKLQICLFNNTDYLDLISLLVYMSKQDEKHKENVDKIINTVLTKYEIYYNKDGPMLPLESWSLPFLERAYGFAMAIYARLPHKSTQYINLTRAIQLPLILECFLASVTTPYSETLHILDLPLTASTKLNFDPNSLWSLIPLSTWTYDYLRWILREWNMLFNRKRPTSSLVDITQLPVHAALLLHKDSRITLCKVLKIMHCFIQFTSTAHLDPTTANIQPLLQQSTCTLVNDETIAIKDAVDFLTALDEAAVVSDATDVGESNRWSVLLSSNLTRFDVSRLEKTSEEFKERCGKPAIYIEKEEAYKFDVVRKAKLPSHVLTNKCLRCHQEEMYTSTDIEMNDPYYHVQWYQSIARKCVCGGLFH